MPRILPNGLIPMLARPLGFAPINLLEISTLDGTNYFLSDVAGNYISKLTGLAQNYSAWLKSAGPFRLSREQDTDGGDILLQNLSGNLIDRDVAAALKNHEFEGALAVYRLWHPLFADVIFEFHGSLTEQDAGEEEAQFRLVQLLDGSMYAVPEYDFTEQCRWRYKSGMCGSTGAAATCDKLYATCQDANHAATERFGGITIPPPQTVFPQPVTTTIFPGANGGGTPGPTPPPSSRGNVA